MKNLVQLSCLALSLLLLVSACKKDTETNDLQAGEGTFTYTLDGVTNTIEGMVEFLEFDQPINNTVTRGFVIAEEPFTVNPNTNYALFSLAEFDGVGTYEVLPPNTLGTPHFYEMAAIDRVNPERSFTCTVETFFTRPFNGALTVVVDSENEFSGTFNFECEIDDIDGTRQEQNSTIAGSFKIRK